MPWLASFALQVLHFVYWLFIAAKSLWRLRTRSEDAPLPLNSKRSKTPTHLALLLATDTEVDAQVQEEAMIEAVEKAVAWCRVAGIGRLTVYDRQGLLSRLSLDIHSRLLSNERCCDAPVQNVPIKLPPTPPPSDDADSRPLSPSSHAGLHKLNVTTLQLSARTSKQRTKTSNGRTTVRRRRHPSKSEHIGDETFTLHFVSRQSGKAAIASIANSVLQIKRCETPQSSHTCDVDEPSIADLKFSLEGEHGFPSPDLMIIHHVTHSEACYLSPELHGFPPWNIRLTEIYRDDPPKWRWWGQPGFAAKGPIRPLGEIEFRRALDEFAAAEQRMGK